MGVYIPRLPNAYQEVEYIGSSWTQYINTDIKLNQTHTIELKLNINSNLNQWDKFYWWWDAGSMLFAQYEKSSGTAIQNRIKITNKSSNTMYSTNPQTIAPWWTHIFVHSNTSFYIDGVSQSTTTATTFTMNTGLNIFAMWNSQSTGREKSSYKLYYMKIYNSDNSLAYCFIPCYRKSDNEIWLYDLTNNQFYINAWTGTFSKWTDVTAMPLKNAYIGGYYEYSYDFSNKSVALMQADGWTFSSTSNWSFSSNGIDCSSQQRAFLTLDVLSEAKKITIENVYVVSTTSRSRWVRFCLSTSELWNPAGHYWSGGEVVTRIDIPSYTKSISSYSWTGTKTCKVVLDLENKTWLLTYTGLSEISQTFNEASANIIRTYKTLQLFFSGWTGAEVKTVKVTVEK